MKKLPIGKQYLAGLINDGYLYVDKTEIIYKLIATGSVYFLSRPRRFGKSLTVSTLMEIFSGNKELFKGLWIYDKIDWKEYPVIHIDFSEIIKKSVPVIDSINLRLNEIASENNITLRQKDYGLRFRELIRAVAADKPVVILIDEYDKPIIDYIEDIPQAEENRDILKNFYSVLKGSDKFIKFLFITGVSKFSKVSIFSDLNHLYDITLDDNYAALTGYTEDELFQYFSDYIGAVQNKYEVLVPDIKVLIRDWYNGYSWDGKTFVYNPYSLLNFFSQQKFEDYWFKSGTPTFLMKLIKERKYPVMQFDNLRVRSDVFDKYELSGMELVPLLFQTGYLTVKNYELSTGYYTLAYPNKEVELSFSSQLLSTLNETSRSENSTLLQDMQKSLAENDVDGFIHFLKVIFKNITYPLIEKRENYYHSVFYLIIKLLGFDIETEVLTCDGRIDAVIKTGNYIYIVEFKLASTGSAQRGTAQEAIDQIKKKEYALKYDGDKKEI
ncbi:MAG: ATP-binding protein, partial [Bacteroidetes bacterium]|nr:ATP-binding protein [Bacteroidota bacterium]